MGITLKHKCYSKSKACTFLKCFDNHKLHDYTIKNWDWKKIKNIVIMSNNGA